MSRGEGIDCRGDCMAQRTVSDNVPVASRASAVVSDNLAKATAASGVHIDGLLIADMSGMSIVNTRPSQR